MCNDTGGRTFHNNEYLNFDKFHYKNRIPFAMHYDFESVIENGKHLPIACGLYIKSDYSDILEDEYEIYCGEEVVDWFIGKMSHYNEIL